MFCKGDVGSMQLLQGAYKIFSMVHGLQANNEKNCLYITGVKPDMKQTILSTLGYVQSEIHIKYLGVPISSNRLTIAQCMPLMEKITEKIRCQTTKLLSYAGRIELLK